MAKKGQVKSVIGPRVAFREKGKTGRPTVHSKGIVLSPQAVRIAERRLACVTLRRDGYSMAEIAQQLKISMTTVAEDIQFVLSMTIAQCSQTAEESRELQLQRLDSLLKTYMNLATQPHNEIRIDRLTGNEAIVTVPPDPRYAQIILQVEARRAKLLSLDVPEVKKLETTGIREYINVDIERV